MKDGKMTKIQILGTGCSKCKKLMENAEKAASELDGNYEVIKVTDIKEIEVRYYDDSSSCGE
jgi:thiol-disulfide isomerase/thioredoxin